uniref:Fungal lipase-like domain-containing protein n=1 Tax=Oryza glumipatula TaxID=40148 RepID=A0A0D9ZA56_9ORYZ
MDASTKCFGIAGPTHIAMNIDWDKEEHRRCIVASILKGTSIHTNKKYKELAPRWWMSFHFELYRELKEDDQFMFGAIYRYKPPAGEPRHPSAPHYVFAFRGTMLEHDRPCHDLYHDWKVVTNDFRNCRHFNRAVDELSYILIKPSSTPATGVWLAGHSLGASFALDGGTLMIARDLNLPTFLFNPPQVSMAPVINLGLSNKAKNDLYDFSYKMKYILGKTKKLRRHSERMEVLFEKLSPWQPQLYVHEGDVVCQGFIDYFEQRERLLDRYPDITLLAMMMSYRDMISYLIGEDKEQPHLLPSARLWKVKKQSHSEDAHGLKQWWMPNNALGWSIYERGYKYIWKGKGEKGLQGCAPGLV